MTGNQMSSKLSEELQILSSLSNILSLNLFYIRRTFVTNSNFFADKLLVIGKVVSFLLLGALPYLVQRQILMLRYRSFWVRFQASSTKPLKSSRPLSDSKFSRDYPKVPDHLDTLLDLRLFEPFNVLSWKLFGASNVA